MLRLVQIGNGLPISYPVDCTAVFQPGMIAQMKVLGNEVVCGVSDGSAPLGIIDDINTAAFTAPITNEVVDIPAIGVPDGQGNYFAAAEVMKNLRFANIVRSSFVADVSGIALNDVNGLLIAPAGTKLNYDLNGDGIPDTIRVVVSYIYRIPNIPGDNTMLGSGQITVWITRGIYETDQYDTTQKYAVNATLYVNSEGKLTSKQEFASAPGVALCTGPNTSINNSLEFLWI